MNLKLIFNKNYFKENIKKSKGILAFLFGVVPLLNILYLIVCLSQKVHILNFNNIGLITKLGLYIIPIALSITLFGFLFKQKSVDFVMSKPISRKTMYFTNIIGGIVLLILFMLVNTFIFGLFGLLFENLLIPFSLLLDYFIYYLISYVFMYSVISIAVVFSGNFISSIIILLIIVLMYPFLTLSQGYLTKSYNMYYIKCSEKECMPLKYECYNEECKEELKQNNYYYYLDKTIGEDYTAPLSFGFNNLYNSKTLLKMFVLSLIYFVIGYFLFKKRKMEENEIGFKSELKHYLVKSITLIPVCLITYFLMNELNIIGLLIGIALSIIYYIIYDLITRKEIYKIGKSLIIFIITFGLFNGIYAIVDKYEANHVLNVNDIKSIEIDISGIKQNIKDKEIINKIISSMISQNNQIHSYYNSKIITNSGTYNVNIGFGEEHLYQEVNNYLKEDYKKILLNYNYDSIDAIYFNSVNIPVTKELKKIIKDSINYYTNSDYISHITLYNYNNHMYETINLSIKLTEKLYEYILEYSNKALTKEIKNNDDYIRFYLSEVNDNNTKYFTDLDNYIANYVLNNNIELFVEYLENNNEITYTKEYIDIYYYANNSTDNKFIRISDIEGFKKEFNKYKNRVDYKELEERFNETNKEVKYEY